MFTLRPYQREACDAAVDNFKMSRDPALIVLPTGAGKSLVVAELAKYYGTALVLHPSKELCAQNAKKYAAYDLNNHSIYCAGLGEKDGTGDVIFATHQSLNLDEMPPIKIIIVDEAHKFSAAMQKTYDVLKKRYPAVLLLGLTATPYMIGRGFIYQQAADGTTLTEEEARNPFFLRCVYELPVDELIKQGYLSPLTVGTPDVSYDCSGLETNASGWFTADSVEKATTSDRNATTRIVAQILRVLEGRKAAMIFASSVEHAKTIMALIPGKRARLITGDTPARLRATWLRAFEHGMFDVLVNVATLTTGVDLPVVDTIAIMRPSESASLWQQIVGRGMRLSPETGKTDCLLLDYTENMDTFFPSGDIYRPEVRAVRERKKEYLNVACPTCEYLNRFVLATNEMGLPVSPDGYFMDLTGQVVRDDSGNKMIAHHGRRCQRIHENGERCDHRFIAKVCPSCKTNNDIAARKCSACETVLVDWNRHLKALASRLPTKESQVGTWTIGRVETVEVEHLSERGARAAFFCMKRKQPVRKWLQGNKSIYERLIAGDMPHAVAWRKNLKGQNDVRVLWSPHELDKFTEKAA